MKVSFTVDVCTGQGKKMLKICPCVHSAWCVQNSSSPSFTRISTFTTPVSGTMSGDSHRPEMQCCGTPHPKVRDTGANAPEFHPVWSNGVITLRASNSFQDTTPHRVCDATASVKGRRE